MTKFGGALALSLALTLCLAACGERPQVVNYKQGSYQGKPDTPQWEHALETRAQNQNEYKRIR